MANFSENRKVRFEFEVLETYEAGIELNGIEVKAIKNHKMNLEGSYIFPKLGEFWLVGATVSPYQPNNTPSDYDPQRDRKLLLQKKEINYLIGKVSTRGLTIVPVRVYNKKNKIKLEIAVAKKKQSHDKREVIKEREDKRKIERTLKEI
jgi:SsrA-binding protein